MRHETTAAVGAQAVGRGLPSARVKLLSANVGAVRDAEWRGEALRTGIFKTPVEGRVTARALGLDGDAQADLSVHGTSCRAGAPASTSAS